MNEYIYKLHLIAGRNAGIEKTCGNKNKFENIEDAQRAANAHNHWEKRNHDVEPYPCFFCETWHIGRIMSLDELEKYKME